MTPRQLGALSGRHDRRQQREDLLVGILAAATANWGFCAPEEAKKPWDFVPSLKPPDPPEKSEDEIAAHFDALFSPFVIPVAAG